jgi:hypothetical protein
MKRLAYFSIFSFIDFMSRHSKASKYLGAPCLHGSSGMSATRKNMIAVITILYAMHNLLCIVINDAS